MPEAFEGKRCWRIRAVATGTPKNFSRIHR
jgi:hypothetical protein